MGDYTRNFFHISLSQEYKFSFEAESGHFNHILCPKMQNYLKQTITS